MFDYRMWDFEKLWNNEVRNLAVQCITEPEALQLITKGGPSSSKDLKNINCKDLAGMFSIANMIYEIDHALEHNRHAILVILVRETYDIINNPNYFKDIINEDENDEEWKTRKALRDGLHNLLQVL